MADQAAVVIGVGARQGIGAAVAVKAAAHGMHVFIAGRTQSKLDKIVREINAQGGEATAVVTDCTSLEDLENLFEKVKSAGLTLGLTVYNTGRNLPAPFMEHDTRIIQDHWKRCVYGGAVAGQFAVGAMLEQDPINGHRGTIIYTGASASLRGKPLFSGFAAAKAGVRLMAESMFEELGPQGIHVAHVVIDGVINGELIRSVGPFGRLILNQKGQDGSLMPDEIATNYWMLHKQNPGSWCFEIDLRPFKESF